MEHQGFTVFVKCLCALYLEVSGTVEFYNDNDEFMQTIKRDQDPIHSPQAHVIYNFSARMWLGLDANYYWGGETSKNGMKSAD